MQVTLVNYLAMPIDAGNLSQLLSIAVENRVMSLRQRDGKISTRHQSKEYMCTSRCAACDLLVVMKPGNNGCCKENSPNNCTKSNPWLPANKTSRLTVQPQLHIQCDGTCKSARSLYETRECCTHSFTTYALFV